MLAVVQFPFADSRSFLAGAFGRLSVPDWPDPKPKRLGSPPQFLRRFGSAGERRGSGGRGWSDEHGYCHASRALRFPSQPGEDWLMAPCGVSAFRRVLVDNTGVVGRAEFGFAQPLLGIRRRIDEGSLIRLVVGVLEAPSLVHGSARPKPLMQQGRDLAALYQTATTKHGATASVGRRVVEDGEPIVIVDAERTQFERGSMRGTQRVPPDLVYGADLRFLRVKTDLGTVAVWMVSAGTSTKDESRALRLALLRLHAEREALKTVIHWIRRGAVTFDKPGDERDRLEDYLNDATRLVEKDRRGGVSQSAIRAALDAAFAVGEPDEALDLADQLQGAKKQVARKVLEHARFLSSSKTFEVVLVSRDYVNNSISIANSTLTNSNVLAAQRMDNVLNGFNRSSADDELKTAITELHEQAKALISRLDDKSATEVSDRVAMITEQAGNERPLGDIVRAAATGLITLSSTVAGLADPVGLAVRHVLAAMKIALS